jgi:hypothetical protein
VSAAANPRFAHLAIAVAGLVAVAIPVFVGDLSDLASSALFILPMIGAVAWVGFLLRFTLPRRIVSAAAVILGAPVYGAAVLLVIVISMKFGVGA